MPGKACVLQNIVAIRFERQCPCRAYRRHTVRRLLPYRVSQMVLCTSDIRYWFPQHQPRKDSFLRVRLRSLASSRYKHDSQVITRISMAPRPAPGRGGARLGGQLRKYDQHALGLCNEKTAARHHTSVTDFSALIHHHQPARAAPTPVPPHSSQGTSRHSHADPSPATNPRKRLRFP